LVRSIVEDVSAILLPKKIFCQFCGMQLRSTPTEKEYKEKLLKRKIRERKRKLGIGCIEVSSAELLNTIFSMMLRG
jgi:hypothetical protein